MKIDTHKGQFSIDEITCVFAPNYVKYLDKVHNFDIYQDLLICPRNLGLEKSVTVIRELDREQAYSVYSRLK